MDEVGDGGGEDMMVDDDDFEAMMTEEDVMLSMEMEATQTAVAAKDHWRRPKVAPHDPAKSSLVFQQLDIDHYLVPAGSVPGMPGARSGPVPVMRMFGVNKTGNSICCHVHGFHPYFYVSAPKGFTKDNLADFRRVTHFGSFCLPNSVSEIIYKLFRA
jgi:hypothetical protein